MSKDIKQTINLNCTPKEFFHLMTNAAAHKKFTGAPAKLSKKVGSAFQTYGMHCQGMMLELKDNKEIVQAWRGSNWPKGVFSVVSFKIAKNGSKTKVTMNHTGVPEKFSKDIKAGWTEHYWTPMKAHLKTAKATSPAKKTPTKKKAAAKGKTATKTKSTTTRKRAA